MLKVKSSQHGVTFFLKIFLNPNFQQLFQDTAYTFLTRKPYGFMQSSFWVIMMVHVMVCGDL